MMLVKLVNKHDTAVDYLDGGMESLLEKGLRMQHHGITLASRNLTLVLAKVAAVPTLAERMSAMSCVIKCINCTNAVLDLAASVVQLRFRFRRYLHGTCYLPILTLMGVRNKECSHVVLLFFFLSFFFSLLFITANIRPR